MMSIIQMKKQVVGAVMLSMSLLAGVAAADVFFCIRPGFHLCDGRRIIFGCSGNRKCWRGGSILSVRIIVSQIR